MNICLESFPNLPLSFPFLPNLPLDRRMFPILGERLSVNVSPNQQLIFFHFGFTIVSQRFAMFHYFSLLTNHKVCTSRVRSCKTYNFEILYELTHKTYLKFRCFILKWRVKINILFKTYDNKSILQYL